MPAMQLYIRSFRGGLEKNTKRMLHATRLEKVELNRQHGAPQHALLPEREGGEEKGQERLSNRRKNGT